MRRFHLVEFEDAAWCPAAIRDGITDYLQFAVDFFNPYKNIIPSFQQLLHEQKVQKVLDLCSGAGGPWLRLSQLLKNNTGEALEISLTDFYPNQAASKWIEENSHHRLTYISDRIDVRVGPESIKGFRSIFSAFHHFKPEEAKMILQNAVKNGEGIAIFEYTQRHILMLLYMCLTPLIVLFTTPFIRPFNGTRLLLTYVIPLIPFAVMFDGLVSCLRTYTPQELNQLTSEIKAPHYHWEVGLKKIGFLPVGITYLSGYPIVRSPKN